MGAVRAVEPRHGSVAIEIEAPFASDLVLGQSVAIDGACMTVESVQAGAFSVSAIQSTLERTVAGEYQVGTAVNLERAMPLGARLDGHIVQGHVDGVGRLIAVRDAGDTRFLDFEIPEAVSRVTILHGSITLNGISLTVNGLEQPRCQVAIIPFTWEHTNISTLTSGDPVNVEGDLIGKYVQRMAAPWVPGHGDDSGAEGTDAL